MRAEQHAPGWREGFFAMSVLLGEPEDVVARALGKGASPARLPEEKDARARLVAAGLAAISHELDAQGRAPWPA